MKLGKRRRPQIVDRKVVSYSMSRELRDMLDSHQKVGGFKSKSAAMRDVLTAGFKAKGIALATA